MRRENCRAGHISARYKHGDVALFLLPAPLVEHRNKLTHARSLEANISLNSKANPMTQPLHPFIRQMMQTDHHDDDHAVQAMQQLAEEIYSNISLLTEIQVLQIIEWLAFVRQHPREASIVAKQYNLFGHHHSDRL